MKVESFPIVIFVLLLIGFGLESADLIQYSAAIVDSDGDGLSDEEEVNIYGTDPFSDDSDLDGIEDGDEINIYQTNPNRRDTDGDGESDGDEVFELVRFRGLFLSSFFCSR